MNRIELIKNLKQKQGKIWDIIVIGGGATGLGVALDGISRGYETLLLEQADFAAATSSRSTKLVHGGVRYLAKGDLLLVIEALHERGIMLKNAPHLTSDQEFIIPLYSWFDVVKYYAGLKFYDLLSGRLSLGKSYYINKTKTLSRLPNLKEEGLRGGIVYHDGQFDDSRMAIALARECIKRGATTLNYFRVSELLKGEEGNISGVKALEMISGEEFNIYGRVVINATGVFADSISKMDDPSSRPSIRPSQGIHLVLDRSFLQSNSAIMIPKTDDGRVLFAIPWYNEVVVGTTDTPLDDISLEPVAQEKEIEFILHTAASYLKRPPEREDVLSIYAGLRPLAADPSNPGATKEVSRRHKITLSRSGLLSVVGGKWTTYRRMAEETLDRAVKAGLLEKRKCLTRNLKLTDRNMLKDIGRLKIYGEGYDEIEKMITEDPGSGLPLHKDLPYTRAEILWICKNEMPLHLDDVLARRTRAILLNARASAEIAPDVVGIMAEKLGYDSNWQKKELESYNELINKYI
ncbi:MAG TPA: glycerol-3-phosphate dehydrogenase/oxidase [Bacteroidales bacterium]|nr:glycerol-3-phosphate dehydrogenase/oxidase [Bacteroidales bacterium]